MSAESEAFGAAVETLTHAAVVSVNAKIGALVMIGDVTDEHAVVGASIVAQRGATVAHDAALVEALEKVAAALRKKLAERAPAAHC